MKTILYKLSEGYFLDYEESSQIMSSIAENKISNEEIHAFISLFLSRELSIEELSGFKNALLNVSVNPHLHTDQAIDVCGTGGDGKNTFNISTISAFVVAGAGIPVIKHGNHGVSSFCGSSDALQSLGFNFTNDPEILNEQLYKNNFCFLHAPLFHPALKNVAQFRKSIGLKTLFNQLGPLINPANPKFRLNGTYDLFLAKQYSEIYTRENINYKIVHSIGGYDEISLTNDSIVISNDGEYSLQPENFGFNFIHEEKLFGGNNIQESTKIFLSVLNNESTPEQKNAVLANSALAIQCYLNISLEEAINRAKESIESEKAISIFKNCLL